MKISIIVPSYNEAAILKPAVQRLQSLAGDFEIIVVDGGSVDHSPDLARELNAAVFCAPLGRGTQMNAGASHATGDVLLFLHIDTTLPENTYALIADALKDQRVQGGCFRLRFDHDLGALRWCSLITRLRYPLLHYGDSGYFIRARTFTDLGGYTDYPLMEDIEFWLRFTKRFSYVVLKEAVVTSARRFLREGIFKRQLTNIVLVSLYLLGVSPQRLAAYYRNADDKQPNQFSTRLKRIAEKIWYPIRTLWHWTYSNIHLIGQTYYVLDFMKLHKLNARELDPQHPWVTGLIPGTNAYVWDKNIVFASPRKSNWLEAPEPDEEIAMRLGKFLSLMVKHSSVPDPELPQGSKRRMPHGVNYIHGSIHYNGGLLLFNDFADAMSYISDPKFIKEMKRFGRIEKRELTIVLRERVYDPEEFAWFVTFVRSHVPWFANGNGPTTKRVLFGTPSPYAAVNPINGSWVKDLQLLYRKQAKTIARPPITARYFQGAYKGSQTEYTFLERFHAWAQHVQIMLKGFQGGLVFTSRKKIEPENFRKYVETNGEWRASYSVSHPFSSIERVRARRLQRPGNPPDNVLGVAGNAANVG